MLLQRRDPASRAFRFHRLHPPGPDLFGRAVVLREWGRIGSPGRVRAEIHDSAEAAAQWLDRLLRTKLRKGYR